MVIPSVNSGDCPTWCCLPLMCCCILKQVGLLRPFRRWMRVMLTSHGLFPTPFGQSSEQRGGWNAQHCHGASGSCSFPSLKSRWFKAGLKDHKSGLPNCYPSSTSALSTLTFCHTSLQILNQSSIRNSILLLCCRASLTWVKSSCERHHRGTEFYLFPF